MIQISYKTLLFLITIIWCFIRAVYTVKNKKLNLKREVQLLFVYICIIVVVRYTFFPFFKVDGKIQPLIFDSANAVPFRINWIPFVNLFDYPALRDILINVIGNTTMFIPLGIVWPTVFKELNTPKKAILSGIGCSLCIEILQLPFYDRVTDVDDLILNSAGFILGYLIFRAVKNAGKTAKAKRKGN